MSTDGLSPSAMWLRAEHLLADGILDDDTLVRLRTVLERHRVESGDQYLQRGG